MVAGQVKNSLVCCAVLWMACSLAPTAAAAQDVCADGNKITRLGNPATRFSPPVETLGALQSMIANSRSDVEVLLRRSGFQGDPQDFFNAVASGEGVTETTIAPGTRLGWMFARENGEPELKTNVCWAGRNTFEAFEVQFLSRGSWYSFVVPELCGNLAFLATQQEPVCKVTISDSAGETCSTTSLTIDATGSTGNVTVELTSPNGQTQTLTSGNSSRNLRWTVDSAETTGTFSVVARASEDTPRGNTLECSAEASVARDCCVAGPPTIELTANPDTVEPFQESVVSADPAVSECTDIDEVTIDGNAVSSPYQITKSYPEPGVYTVPGMVRDGRGQTARDSVDITVTECLTKDCKQERKALLREQRRGDSSTRAAAGTGAWILRTWLMDWNADETVRTKVGVEREAYHLDGGKGAGVQLERVFTDHLGLGIGLMAAKPEVHYEFDLPDVWLMDDDDVQVLTLFIGPVFHLLPGRAVDIIFSPFVGYADVDNASLSVPGRRADANFDSEFTYGAQLGLDVPFGSAGWGLHAGAIYQALDMESDNRGFSFDADPLSYAIGLFFRF